MEEKQEKKPKGQDNEWKYVLAGGVVGWEGIS